MSSRLKTSIIFFIFCTFFILTFIIEIPMQCLINKLFGIFCPACGLTRAFSSILNLSFIDAIRYNILAIPLFILIVLSVITLIYDLIKNKQVFVDTCLNIFKKYYILILSLIIFQFVYNNIFNIYI